MIYHAHERDLDFALGGRRYQVPKGAEVDIPDHLTYAVGANGYLLKEGPAPGDKPRRVEPSRPQRPFRPKIVRVGRIAPNEVAEELADVTGEDPAEGDVDDAAEPAGDMDAAERAADQLERQGITLPGRRPRRHKVE